MFIFSVIKYVYDNREMCCAIQGIIIPKRELINYLKYKNIFYK